MDSYPKRDQFFAHRFCRLVLKCCVANEHGQDVAMLLVAVAMTEDSKRYTGPVTFWNEQLVPLVGSSNVRALQRSRDRAVESGWLHYEPGARGRPAKYWVIIPANVVHLSDEGMGCEEEELTTDSRSNVTRNLSSVDELTTDSTSKTTRNMSSVCRQSVVNVSNILPLPSPLPKEEKNKEEAAAVELVRHWRLPTQADQPRNRALLAAWQCVRKRVHGGYLDDIAWEATAIKHAGLSADQWHAALLLSIERQSKGLCVRDYRDEQSTGTPKPKQSKPRPLTEEECEHYNRTGQLPDGALDHIHG